MWRAGLSGPVSGTTRHRPVERREAQGPTSLGPRASKAAGLGNQACRRRAAGRVMVRQRESRKLPGASRRSISFGKRKKGQGGPAPFKKIQATGQRSVGFSLVARMSLKRVYARLQRAMATCGGDLSAARTVPHIAALMRATSYASATVSNDARSERPTCSSEEAQTEPDAKKVWGDGGRHVDLRSRSVRHYLAIGSMIRGRRQPD
jgi:hypothetical protein